MGGLAMKEFERPKVSDVDALPALMDTKEFSVLVGYGSVYVSRLCKSGVIPATKVGRQWRIPTRRALERLGIEG